MTKYIIATALGAAALLGFGAFLEGVGAASYEVVGSLIFIAALLGAISSGLLLKVLYSTYLAPAVNGRIRERARAEAHDELLKCKKLLDEGVLTQAEFDARAITLKKIVL